MRFLLPGRLRLAWLLVVICLVPTVAACSRLGLGAQAVPPTATSGSVAPTAAPQPATPPASTAPATANPTATVAPPTLAAPTPSQTPSVNGLQDTVNQYVQAWQDGRYADMYGLLSTSAQSSIAQDKFVARYTNISTGIDQISVKATATIPSNPTPSGTPPTVSVPMHVIYQLAVLGTIEEDNVLPLVLEGNTWKVAWTPGLIFKDLTRDRVVQYDPVTPLRGSIVDRNGKVLAEDGLVVTVGVVPGEIKDEATLLAALSNYLKVPQDQIKQAYANAQPDWFVPIKDIPESQKADAQQKLNPVLGVAMREKHQRMYPYGNVAAHVVGYSSPVLQPELKTLAPKGYDVGDLIGRSGLEAWGEDTLRGQKGATLSITDSTGQVVRVIARKDAVNGSNLVTTLDIDYQTQATKTLGQKTGSIILMDPRDNSILAIASYPTYDPNLFITGMTDAQWKTLNGPNDPLLFRAASGLYPTGSIFKVITMAAGLEKGGFKTTDTFNCGLDWNGLPGVTLHNWKAEGTLNLIQSLTGSCDPTFYTIGLKLNQIDPNILPTFARGFGLGQSTGAVGINDPAGLVPDPAWKQQNIHQPWYDGDGVNLAIGQGYLLATPLQMANLYSAIANHGTLRTPILVSQIKGPDGTVVKSFTAESRGTLPVSAQNLGYIVQGMKGVTSTPLGTAYYAWSSSKIPMAAKTGSAENETSKAHAWFVGYTTPDQPRVLALVMLEGGELGGEFAAPLGRQVVEYAVAHPEK